MQVAVVVKLILTYCWPLKAGVSLIVLIELVQQFKLKKISSTTIKSELVRLLLRSLGPMKCFICNEEGSGCPQNPKNN